MHATEKQPFASVRRSGPEIVRQNYSRVKLPFFWALSPVSSSYRQAAECSPGVTSNISGGLRTEAAILGGKNLCPGFVIPISIL